MRLPDGAAVGHLLGALAYAGFFLYYVVFASRSGLLDGRARLLLAAVGCTAAWSAAVVLERDGEVAFAAASAYLLDLLRYGLWYAFVLATVRPAASTQRAGRRWDASAWWAVALLAFNVAVGVSVALGRELPIDPSRLTLAGALALAIYGLVLVEQLFRNQPDGARWNAKPVCLALVCIFGYDLYVYSDALMFARLDADALEARGAIHALAVPLLFVASRRHRAWLRKLQVSRSAAFYSAALLLAGGYLMFMAVVGYYVRFFGGSWGRALQFAVVFGALVVGVGLVLSATLRARLRVFLNKNFFSYRYDYRQEWLRFTEMLSSSGSPQEVGVLVVRGLANLIECPAGALWTRGLDGQAFVQSAQWNVPRCTDLEPVDTSFCRFMRERDWIIDLAEYRDSPRRYESLILPRWLLSDPHAWLVVPLVVGDDMTGFALLNKPLTPIELNWEVRDLLKTASRQAAGFLARMHATEALLEARKFDAFNRMSAFVVHDLKNIVTQLSLMLKNAERHRDNPEFQQDMLLTVESSLEKMRQMMVQLREGQKPTGLTSGVDLEKLLRALVASARLRGRTVELEVAHPVSTRGHEERVSRVLGHVVQNALDATPAEGRVWVTLSQSAGRAMVQVGDTGVGMTREFIQTRLFKPFSTTKQAGMGIGSYESFHYIKELGGQIEVDSEVGRGTTVTVLLPLFDTRKQSDLQMTGES